MNPPYTEYRLKVNSRAHTEGVQILTDGRLVVHTKMPPENNLANLDIILQISKHMSVPQKNVVICRGHTMPNKTIRVYTEVLQ